MGTVVVFIVVIGLGAIIVLGIAQYKTQLGQMLSPWTKRLAAAGLATVGVGIVVIFITVLAIGPWGAPIFGGAFLVVLAGLLMLMASVLLFLLGVKS